MVELGHFWRPSRLPRLPSCWTSLPLNGFNIKFARSKNMSNSLTEALLKCENFRFEDFKRVTSRKVATLNTHTGHFYSDKPPFSFQEIPEDKIGIAHVNFCPPRFVIIPVRAFGPFVLLADKQHISFPWQSASGGSGRSARFRS